MTENEKILLKALNKIEDYFEYRCESLQDKQYVYKVLGELYEAFSKGS